MTSELENYLPTIQEQKLCTKYLKNKRALDSGKSSNLNNKCRLCSSISYFRCLPPYVCKILPSSWTVLDSHLKKFYPSKNIALLSEPNYINKENSREYWWNVSVKTVTKILHNKPDLMISY